MVERDGLENRCAFTGTVGSNPTPSAGPAAPIWESSRSSTSRVRSGSLSWQDGDATWWVALRHPAVFRIVYLHFAAANGLRGRKSLRDGAMHGNRLGVTNTNGQASGSLARPADGAVFLRIAVVAAAAIGIAASLLAPPPKCRINGPSRGAIRLLPESGYRRRPAGLGACSLTWRNAGGGANDPGAARGKREGCDDAFYPHGTAGGGAPLCLGDRRRADDGRLGSV